MSILRYFKSKSNQAGLSFSAIQPEVHLPDPHGQLSGKVPTEAIVLSSVNVKEVVIKNEASQKKREPYLHENHKHMKTTNCMQKILINKTLSRILRTR